MSWEDSRVRAICDDCGHEGVCIISSDDWNRTKTSWEGFNAIPPDPTSVGRQRVGTRDMKAECPACGGKSISRRECLD